MKAIGSKSETFDEEVHSESRLVLWEMKRLRSNRDRFRKSLIGLTSCDNDCVDNYISFLESFALSPDSANRQKTKTIHITKFKNFLKVENQNFDLSSEALDNLRKSTAEAILFLERQTRDF